MPAKPPPKPASGTKDKAAAKAAQQERRAAAKQRRAQVLEAFNIQRREDKALLPLMIVWMGLLAFAIHRYIEEPFLSGRAGLLTFRTQREKEDDQPCPSFARATRGDEVGPALREA